MFVIDSINEGGSSWVLVETGRGLVTFTQNEDGSLYAVSTDGGALQDTESDFISTATAQEMLALRKISKRLTTACKRAEAIAKQQN